MELKFAVQRGWPKQRIQSLSRLLVQQSKTSASLKVGVTSNYRNRRNYYSTYESQYTEMVLIYRTNSLENATTVERELIDMHWDILDNERAGGGGQLGQGQKPYYVYLVRRPKAATRSRASTGGRTGKRTR